MVIKKKVSKKKQISKKPLKKKTVKKKVIKKAAAKPKKIKGVIGVVTHYFPKVRAAVVKLKTSLSVGDPVKIKGHTTDFAQQVTSMQIDHVPIQSAKKGQEIGLLVESRVRRKDLVLKA